MNYLARSVIGIICMLFINTNSFAQHSSFQGLGDLPGGIFESNAFGVSSDGSVIVGYGTTNNGKQAFRWTQATGMVSLGNLPDNYFHISSAGYVSADGSTVFGSGDTTSPNFSFTESQKGFRWTSDTGMIPVIGLYGLTNGGVSCLSADKTVVVGSTNNQAFRWTENTGIVGLGTLPGQSGSDACGVSDDGTIIAGSCWTNPNRSSETYIWTAANGMKSLGNLTGYNGSSPNSISPDGSVIVGYAFDSTTYVETPFRWTKSTGMVNLGHLPGKSTTHTSGVSSYGKIIVGGSYTWLGDPSPLAFIWDSMNGMRDLKTVLQSEYGLNLTGWALHNASGITPNGNVIIGSGIDPVGNLEAFRVVLDTLLTGVKERSTGTVRGFQLYQNYPNPFNPTTTIHYSLGKPSHVKLSIYNLLGQEIELLTNSFQTAGEHSMVWNATDERNNPVSSGIYFYSLQTDEMIYQRKMVVLR